MAYFWSMEESEARSGSLRLRLGLGGGTGSHNEDKEWIQLEDGEKRDCELRSWEFLRDNWELVIAELLDKLSGVEIDVSKESTS